MDPSATPPSPLLLRLIVVAAVAALGQLWLRHHLGWGGDTPWIAAFVVFLSLLDTALGKLMGKDAKAALDAWLRVTLAPVFTGRLAMLACAVAILLALVFSSVTVLPGSDAAVTGTRLKARLFALDGKPMGEHVLASEKSIARFPWLLTSPFGRPYRLAVDGYLDETLMVYPLTGSNISAERDLRRSPSVLFRPPADAVQVLASGGNFTVMWRSPGGLKPLAPPQTGHEGSFLVGRAQSVPASTVTGWRLELAASNIGDPTLSQMLQNWSRFQVIKPTTPLAAGMQLVGEVRSPRSDLVVVVARAEVVLGTEPLMDVPMMLVVPPGG